MADPAATCTDHREVDGWLPPPDPGLALNYHFGMLLGVADFQCEQAYFRGKSRLHNAWLHGRGVVWGYEVAYEDKSGEARVKPGFALDGAGRELLLDAEVCASVSEWVNEYIKADTQPALSPDGFDLQVVAKARTCLSRPVPAIAVPCADNTKSTAYSRISERVDVLFRLVPDKSDAPPPFHRVRLFLGVDEPLRLNGAVVPEDQIVLDRQANTAGDSQARLAAFRQLAALDTLDLHPPTVQDGDPFPLFPEPDTAVVLLAVIKGVKLKKDGAVWKAEVDPKNVDPTVRSTLLPTQTIQELAPGGGNAAAAGPRVIKVEVDKVYKSISLTLDKDVLPTTLSADSVFVSIIEPNGAGGWKPQVTVATPDAGNKKVVTVSVPNQPGVGGLIRLIVRGTGPKPVLGSDLAPFAGPGAARATAHDGADFVYTVRRK